MIRQKETGSMGFLIVVCSLMLLCAFSVACACSLCLRNSENEISLQQMRLSAKSAANQVLYRVKEKNSLSGMHRLQQTSAEWEEAMLGSTDGKFVFDKSCDENFRIEDVSNIELTFSGGLDDKSVCNFLGSLPVKLCSERYAVPPYSSDLIIKVKNGGITKRFNAVISKKWPFAVFSGKYAVDIASSSSIDGDIFSMGLSSGTPFSIAVRDDSGIIDGCLMTSHSPDDYGGRDLICVNPSSEKNNNIKITYDFNFSDSIYFSSIIPSEPADEQYYSLEDELTERGIIEEIQPEAIRQDAGEYISESGECDWDSVKFMDEYAVNIIKERDNGRGSADKIYILKEKLNLSGSCIDANSDTEAVGGHASYVIHGSLVAFPDFFLSNSQNSSESIGITCSDCSLFVTGDIIFFSKYLDVVITSSRPQDEILKEYADKIPYISGHNAAAAAGGNIYLAGAQIESSGKNFVVYSNENLYLRPVSMQGYTEQMFFKGAVASRKLLSISPCDSENGKIFKNRDMMKIKGAVACGEINTADMVIPPAGMSIFEIPENNVVLIQNTVIEYDSESIELLHRQMGIPKLVLWREL